MNLQNGEEAENEDQLTNESIQKGTSKNRTLKKTKKSSKVKRINSGLGEIALNLKETEKKQRKVLKHLCHELQQTYIDKMHLDGYLYSFKVALVDDKRSSRYMPASKLSVRVAVVSSTKGKTKVKNFNSIFYRDHKTFLGSWVDYFWKDYTDKYHSGPIILDNTHSNLVMIYLSIPRARLEIKSVSVENSLELHFLMYYFIKFLPISIFIVAFFASINFTLFSSLFLIIIILKLLQGNLFGGSKEKDEGTGVVVPTAASPVSTSQREAEYLDID